MSRAHDLVLAALRGLDPETAHALTIIGLQAGLGPRISGPADPILATRLAGLDLPTPIGLAAGFDKNADVPAAMLRAGFGFVECGTATPLPQAGNPRPRLFRLNEDFAVINRMGFNNAGLNVFAANLKRRRGGGVVGANIGANKESPDRIVDYVTGLCRLDGLADYFTINISSPNTPGLRELQTKGPLEDLLGAVRAARQGMSVQAPVFLKVAPDLCEAEVADILEAAVTFGLEGLIISNTTLERPQGLRSAARDEAGGLSGAPLMAPSTRLLAEFHAAAAGRLRLIGVGGVASGAEAYAKIRAGADAVQLYSALVYQGPDLAARAARDLAARLRADGFEQVSQAVGAR
jgi:dihydroorotate dehydrogenase